MYAVQTIRPHEGLSGQGLHPLPTGLVEMHVNGIRMGPHRPPCHLAARQEAHEREGEGCARRAKGKFYLIECPDGTMVVRCAVHSGSNAAESHDPLVVPSLGQQIEIPSDPHELLPRLAESRLCGLSLIRMARFRGHHTLGSGDTIPISDLASGRRSTSGTTACADLDLASSSETLLRVRVYCLPW
jgi:hypothetical protein